MILKLVISSFMGSFLLWAILVFDLLLKISGNAEGDALNVLKNNLADPNNVLQSWDPTQATPCMWFRVTCNSDNRVTRVDLGDENLSGQLVPQLGQLPNLQYLELYGNNISGKIPDELGNLTNLVSLDLYFNGLTGPIPNTLGNLKKLRFLRLNNNSLSGNIPMSLFTVASLQVLDLSNNLLIGDVPVHGSFSSIASISFQNNPGLKQQTFPPPSAISPMPKAPSGNNATAVIAGVAAGTALSFAAPAIAIAIAYWRRRKQQDIFFDVPAAEPEVHHQVKQFSLHGLSLAAAKTAVHPQVEQFSLNELKFATDNFSGQNLVGRGGFAEVYKGCLADGSVVAVKRFREESFSFPREQELQREVKIISMAVHRNLLRLRGFCMTSTELLLVYPFMVNGNLGLWLGGHPGLQSRKRVALGAARGLAYLHSHCDLKIIHRDIKPSNIMLDERFEAVIGDFGLVRFMDFNDTCGSTSRICGTYGYMAPEHLLFGKFSDKSDVYGYGGILLELIGGQGSRLLSDSSKGRAVKLYDWAKGLVEDTELETLVDANLQGDYNEEEVKQLVQVSLLCTQDDPRRRPRMSEVVGMLEGDDFSAKWEQFLQNEEVLRQDRGSPVNWIEDSASDISPDELSGPR